MERRHILVAAAGTLVLPRAYAHHGWSSFDQERPLYLEGKAAAVKWRNPHVEFMLEVPADLKLPADLAQRAVPAQTAPVDGKVVFAGTFKSYGWLLILEHGREYHTLLWGFARLDVERGDQVHVGQIVGVMGARGDDPPVLHLERRRNGRPIDLAASSNGIQG